MGGGRHQSGGSNGITPTCHPSRCRSLTEQKNKNKNKMTFSCSGTEEQWHRRGEEAAEATARYRVCLPPLPFGGKKKQNKAKQSKQNTTTRSAAAARLPPDRHGANICARLVGRVGRFFFARPAWRSKQPPPVSCGFFFQQ